MLNPFKRILVIFQITWKPKQESSGMDICPRDRCLYREAGGWGVSSLGLLHSSFIGKPQGKEERGAGSRGSAGRQTRAANSTSNPWSPCSRDGELGEPGEVRGDEGPLDASALEPSPHWKCNMSN